MNIKVLKHDTCYTFMLKCLNVFDKFCNIESDDFVKLFDMQTFNKNILEDFDVIVYTTDNYTFSTNELINGVPISKMILDGLHFIVCYNNLAYDVTYKDGIKHIRIRLIKDLKIDYNYVKIIKKDSICQYQKY